MPKTIPEQNKAIVLKAFDTLFNQRNYAAAERFWSPIHSAQRAHRARTRRTVRSDPVSARYVAL
jgi:hypothetical protein